MRDPAYSAHWRSFAAYLRPLVKSHMTIREFSERIGLSYPHTSRIMTGASGVSRETVGRIACELGLTTHSDITRLYRQAGYPPPLPTEEPGTETSQDPSNHFRLLEETMSKLQSQQEEFRILLEEIRNFMLSQPPTPPNKNRTTFGGIVISQNVPSLSTASNHKDQTKKEPVTR